MSRARRAEACTATKWSSSGPARGGSPARTSGRACAHLVVSGPVADLMLVVSGRAAPEGDRLSVTGDRALLHHWLARTAL
ncbi:hypothetical protein ACFY8W_01290 [Streptomyces sp. NPDC012637]|uniref:hypothetical protein n=1 Tax=Streptomyces sp. NPDC012637 TaxID=3364842 RepID=UPI0036F010E4